MKARTFILLAGLLAQNLFALPSFATEFDFGFDPPIDPSSRESLEKKVRGFIESQPLCVVRPKQMKIYFLHESSGASSSVVEVGDHNHSEMIPSVEAPFIYMAHDSVLNKSRKMSEVHRDAVLYHEMSHALFDSSLNPKEIPGIWPEAEALFEAQKTAEIELSKLYDSGKSLQDPEVKDAVAKIEKIQGDLDRLWIENPEKGKLYFLYRDNLYLFYAWTEFMADLMTAVHLKNPEIITQALTPFPQERIIPSAQLRKFLPFNAKQLKDVFNPIYYSDLPGYLSPLENGLGFKPYHPGDFRDAHLVFAPLRVFIWNKYFKGKTDAEQKNHLCRVLETINTNLNHWGAWEKITPRKLNERILQDFNF